ncbi:hypothetical protein BP1258B_3329, partial [Burkholderia pseudomallei 1258b]
SELRAPNSEPRAPNSEPPPGSVDANPKPATSSPARAACRPPRARRAPPFPCPGARSRVVPRRRPPAGERLVGERAALAGGFPNSLRCSTVPPSPNGCSINT